MVKITCVGELLVDKIADEKGSLKENTKFVKRPGGAPANVAVAASRMGAETSLAASVGDDEFGDFLVEKMREEDVKPHRIRKRDLKTTLAFASLDENATPHFSFYRGADEKITEDQLQDLDADVVHVGSLPFTDRETAENIFSTLESLDARVSFDPNIRPELMSPEYRDRLEDMLGHTDTLFAAEDELKFFGGLEKVRQEVEEVLVTRGAEGAELVNGSESFSASPPEVEAVDTTGAGDAFTGTFLAHIDEDRKKALKMGVKAAAYSTTEKGAMSALPYRQDLN
ncbi:MAG: carbohydrate kinase family protein [Candidatus Nanosalina sp.]